METPPLCPDSTKAHTPVAATGDPGGTSYVNRKHWQSHKSQQLKPRTRFIVHMEQLEILYKLQTLNIEKRGSMGYNKCPLALCYASSVTSPEFSTSKFSGLPVYLP